MSLTPEQWRDATEGVPRPPLTKAVSKSRSERVRLGKIDADARAGYAAALSAAGEPSDRAKHALGFAVQADAAAAALADALRVQHEALVQNMREVFEAAQAHEAACLATWQGEKAAWREVCVATFGKRDAALRVGDAGLVPRKLADARRALDDARRATEHAGRLRALADADYVRDTTGTAAPCGGKPDKRAWTLADLQAHADRLLSAWGL